MKRLSGYLAWLACLCGVAISCHKAPVELPFPETEEQFAESMKTTAAIDAAAEVIIEEAIAKADYGKMDVDSLARELQGIEGVLSATVESEELIVIKQIDGVHINVFLDSYWEDETDSYFTPFKYDPGTRASDGNNRISSTGSVNGNEIRSPGKVGATRKAQILVPGYDFFVKKTFGKINQDRAAMILSWEGLIREIGYSVTPTKINEGASYDYFKESNLSQQHILIIAGEGKREAVLAKGDKKENVILTALDAHNLTNPVTSTVAGSSPSDMIALGKIKGGTYFCIAPSFLSVALSQVNTLFKDTWVFLAADYSWDNDAFAQVFFNRGAAAVTGFQGKNNKDEALILATNAIAFLSSGFEFDLAMRFARNESVKDGEPIENASTKLIGHKKEEKEGFYLFNPSPLNLHFDPEENELNWDMPSTHWQEDYHFEVVVEGKTVFDETVKNNGMEHYSCSFKPTKNDTYHWYVNASLVDKKGQVWASYKSRIKETVIDSIYEPKPGHLVLDPQKIEFTNVPVSSYALMYLNVSNNGESPVKISRIDCPQPFGVYYEGMETVFPQDIAANGEDKNQRTFSVWFTPQEEGIYSGEIRVFSDADNSPLSLQISGTAVTPSKLLSVSPSTLYFTPYTLGEKPIKGSFKITNTGDRDVTVKSIICPSGFLTTKNGSFTIRADGEREVEIPVYFYPDKAGAYSGPVIILSDAENGPHTVQVSGVAIEKSEEAVPVSGVSLDVKHTRLVMGKTMQLNATVSPSNASNQKLVWISEDDGYCTVDQNGLITGVASGVTKIIVTTVDGGFTDACVVQVMDASAGHEGTGREEWD